MALILGIDAAWTATGSSGIALLDTRSGRRTLVAAHSSYADFLGDNPGPRFSKDVPPDAKQLLQKAEDIAGAVVDLVAIDMPIARTKFSSRRAADNLISPAFGAQWASTHSPNEMRPGTSVKVLVILLFKPDIDSPPIARRLRPAERWSKYFHLQD